MMHCVIFCLLCIFHILRMLEEFTQLLLRFTSNKSSFGKMLHFLQFEFCNPASCLLNSLLVFKYLLLSFFFELHFSEFFVEELGLFETSFLLSDDFSLLELSRKLSLSYLISFFLKLCFAFSLQFALLFKIVPPLWVPNVKSYRFIWPLSGQFGPKQESYRPLWQ